MKAIIVLILCTILSDRNICSGKSVVSQTISPVTTPSDNPEIKKKIINIDTENIDAEVTEMMRNNSLDPQKIRDMKLKLMAKNQKNPNLLSSTESTTFTTERPTIGSEMTSSRDTYEKSYMEEIKHKFEVIRKSNDQYDEQEHEYTFGPICKQIPKAFTYTEWFKQNTWNLFFKPRLAQYKVKNVFVRVYKKPIPIAKTATGVTDCEHPDEFYTVKLSVHVKSTNEDEKMKKREIAVLSIPRYSIGWVEFNATSLVKYWETGRTNHGLAVDVYDQNDVHLDAKNLFYLQDCEAGPRLPWRAIQPAARAHRCEGYTSGSEVYEELYENPRLDLTSYMPANVSGHLRRTRHVKHHHRGHAHRHQKQEQL